MASAPHSDRVLMLLRANRLHEARAVCIDFCQGHKDDPQGWSLLAHIDAQLGDLVGVANCCREMIRLQPGNAEAHHQLGVCDLASGDLDGAERNLSHASALAPDHALCHLSLGVVHLRRGRLTEALAHLERAVRLAPGMAEAHNSLGGVLQQAGRFEEAERSYRQAIQIRPEYATAYNNMAGVFLTQGRLGEAAAAYRKSLSLQPAFADAQHSLGVVLTQMGDIEAALDCYRSALRLNPRHATAHSCLLFALNNDAAREPAELAAEHRRWEEIHAQGIAPATEHCNVREPERKLRVGYVSPDFRDHSVAYFIDDILACHDSTAVETICYADVLRPDDRTARLRRLAGTWRDICGKTDAEVAELIRSDGVDILVDLAGHTAGNRLLVFARKPAPIQVAYLGYPNTTGLRSMDYRLTDKLADPIGQDVFYTEKLIRLTGGFLCYQPLMESPAVAPLLALEKGYVTFGSFNNLAKINPKVVKLWAELLQVAQGARLLIKNTSLTDSATREHYHALFEEQDIPRERIELVGHTPTQVEHLALYRRMDIALDTFPYNGTTTTCEALWMGVPVITLAGKTHAGRVGVSILNNAGFGEWVAQTPGQYISLAAAMARDVPALTALRGSLRQRFADSVLCDGQAFARKVEAAYREMWRVWLAS